jgi:hypothetical protein
MDAKAVPIIAQAGEQTYSPREPAAGRNSEQVLHAPVCPRHERHRQRAISRSSGLDYGAVLGVQLEWSDTGKTPTSTMTASAT